MDLKIDTFISSHASDNIRQSTHTCRGVANINIKFGELWHTETIVETSLVLSRKYHYSTLTDVKETIKYHRNIENSQSCRDLPLLIERDDKN